MTKLKDVARYVRSKNAGPFWVTFDIFFAGSDAFARFHGAAALSSEAIGRLYGVPTETVRRYPVVDLDVLKISIPRTTPQGGTDERDMHSGQMFVRLLELEVDPA